MTTPRIRASRSVARLATLALLALVAFAGCSDSSTDPDDNNNPSGGSNTITGNHYIQAKIDGTVVTAQDDATLGTGLYFNGSGGGGVKPGYLEAQELSFTKMKLVNNRPEVDPTYRAPSITFVYLFAESPYGAEHDTLVKMGSNPFGSEEQEIDGVEIRWTDASGTLWSSALGTADQTGSTFVVTDHTLIQYQIGQQKGGRYFTKGTFSATLYDGTGRSMNVTDGKFGLQTVFGW
jgi:hypothetical protein